MKTEEQKKQDELIRQLFNFLCLRYEKIDGEKFKQAYLAQKLGYNSSLIGKWRKGKSPVPKTKYGDIARFFDIDPIWFRDFKKLELVFDISDTSSENRFSLIPINAPYFLSHLGNYERYKYSEHNQKMNELSASISQKISDVIKDLMTLDFLEWSGETSFESDPKRMELVNSILHDIEYNIISGSYSKLFINKSDKLEMALKRTIEEGLSSNPKSPLLDLIKDYADKLFVDKELMETSEKISLEYQCSNRETREEKEMIVLGRNMSFLDPDKERDIDLSKFLGKPIFSYTTNGDEKLSDIDLSKPCKAKVIYEQYRLLIEGFVKRDPEIMDISQSEKTKKDIELLKICFKNSKESDK